MKKNRLSLIIVITLAVFSVLLILQNSKSTLRRELKDFAITDTSTVTKIFLSDKENRRVTLKKTAPGNWQVNDKYPARIDGINVLLKTMLNVEVKEPVPKVAHNNVVTRMASIAVKVEIYQLTYRINLFNKIKLFQHEKLTKTYYVGDNTQDMLGTYMLMENSTVPFIIHLPGFNGYLTTRYSAKEDDWRDHTLLNYRLSDIKSVTLKFSENPELSYMIEKAGERDFKLTSLFTNQVISNFDTMKIFDYMASFRDIKFEYLLNDMEKNRKDSILASTPFHILTITENSGQNIILKTFHKKSAKGEIDEITGKPVLYDRDRLYALINNGKDFASIQFFVFDKILKPVTFFQKSPE